MRSTIIVAVILLAGGLVWHKLFSKEATIEAAYQACLRQVDATADAARIGAPRGPSPAKTELAVAANAPGVDQILQGTLPGLGGAMCGSIRTSCADNYAGDVCQAALRRHR